MKTLILSHKADIDGISPVIFLKMIREDLEVCLLNANDINPKIVELIKTKTYLNYDEIFVTDLTLDKNSCEMIMNTGYSERFPSACATPAVRNVPLPWAASWVSRWRL